jgi:GNAT superfamily N-acetyltransferase
MSAFVCRRAVAEDLPVICALGQIVNALHHAAWPELFAGPSDAARDEPHWRASLEGPQAVAFVAVADATVVGFVTAAWNDETNPLVQPIRVARVHTLCVVPAWQRHGVGRALMAEAERWASDVGALEVRLNVWSFNRTARDVYEALGYCNRSSQLAKRLARDA